MRAISIILLTVFHAQAFANHGENMLHCHQLNLPDNGSVKCVETAGGMTLSLTGASRIGWNDFQIPAGQTLRIVSQGAAGATTKFPSLHVNEGRGGAKIRGNIFADGPLSLVSPRGIQVDPTGNISAPSVFLATHLPASEADLLAGSTTTFSTSERVSGGIEISGKIGATNGSVVALSRTITVTGTASVKAPGGRVELTAANNGVSGTSSRLTLVRVDGDDGDLQTDGEIEARDVILVSSGSIRNAGSIVTAGPDSNHSVTLTAPTITHENKARSLIKTGRLFTSVNAKLEGRIILPNDGANPGRVPTTRQIPSLSQNRLTDQVLTRLEPSRLSYNQLQEIQTPALAKPTSAASTTALRQADGKEKEKSKAKAEKKQPAASIAASPVVVRRGFFGAVTPK